jgi:hypothetical protein
MKIGFRVYEILGYIQLLKPSSNSDDVAPVAWPNPI